MLPALGALVSFTGPPEMSPCISYSNITDDTEVLLLKMSQQPTQGRLQGWPEKGPTRKNMWFDVRRVA